MTEFRLTRTAGEPAGETWRRVTDWRAHAKGVPLTAVTSMTGGPTRVGTVFVVRSGLGRIGFDDPMEIVRWDPPAAPQEAGEAGEGGDAAEGAAGSAGTGRCRMEKRGRVITGWAEIEVRPHGRGSLVIWVEELRIRPLPRFLDPLVARVGRIVFGRALDGLLRGGETGVRR
ncbi:SRPBCC family protein [Streptomyces sp. CAU 1734]|uniref:SRPBCC family protein n=1 Tax=Streptomyces sp. CAU 1734 TaxID=3140360 RepID=UPI00326050C1